MNRLVAVADRSLTWLIALAERQAKNAAFAIAAFWLLVAAVLPWVDFPLGKDPRGLQLALLRDVPVLPHLQLSSFGAIGFAVFALTMIATWIDRRAVVGGGAVLLALALAVPLQIAFSNPDILRRLASEFDQRQKVLLFTQAFLPVNQGREPGLWPSLAFDTLWERGVTAWYYLTHGWYAFVLAALIVFFQGVSLLPTRDLPRVFAGTLLGLVGLSTLFLAKPYYASTLLDRAYLAQARGDAVRATELYRAVMRMDRWYALGPELYEQIGAIDEARGVSDSPEYHLYKGQVLENQGMQPDSVSEYHLAARAGGDLGMIAHREAARLMTYFGLTLYGQQAFGAALAQWQGAYQEDSFQLQALFYAARANFDIGLYREAIAAGERFCQRASNTYAMADVYSDMGDCYTKLDDHASARGCYQNSFKLDYIINPRGLGALTGN